MKIGKIPKNIKIYLAPKTKIRFRWSDVQFEDEAAADVSAHPAFVTDADNAKTQITAERWTQNHNSSWGKCDKTGRMIHKKNQVNTILKENTPLSNVRIVDLDIRGKGGRAYRALVDETYLVDMREDVMLDTMINVGMGVNATLPGEYVFAQIGSEMKLIRVGSKLHELMVESTEFGKRENIDTLIPGHIYSSKTKTVLYLGEVWYTPIRHDYIARSYWGGGDGGYSKPIVQPSCKRHLYIRVSSISKDLNTILGEKTTYYRSNIELGVSKSKAYREDHGCIDNFDIEIALEEIRSRVEFAYENSLAHGYGISFDYYSAMNISTIPGWIHPIIKEKIETA